MQCYLFVTHVSAAFPDAPSPLLTCPRDPSALQTCLQSPCCGLHKQLFSFMKSTLSLYEKKNFPWSLSLFMKLSTSTVIWKEINTTTNFTSQFVILLTHDIPEKNVSMKLLSESTYFASKDKIIKNCKSLHSQHILNSNVQHRYRCWK